VGRNESCELRQHGQIARRRRRARAHGRPELAQEQDLGDLARLVGGLPVPCAFRFGRAEGGDHRNAQRACIDRDATREIGHQEVSGGNKRIGAAGNLN
jgi:hypothetical protein